MTARLRRSLPKNDTLNGVRVMRIGMGLPIDKWLYPFLAPFAARRLKPDIIHAVLETFAGLALLFCGWLIPRAKRILTLQTLNRHFLRGPILRSPHVVTAISGALSLLAAEHGRSDVMVIPNGIPLADIHRAMGGTEREPGRILFAGRLERMKGVDTLLRAFYKLIHLPAIRHPSPPAMTQVEDLLPRPILQPVLRIVGDGSERQHLEQLARTLDIDTHVTFLGRLTTVDLFREYAEAEIFCGLSRSEAMGNVFVEAQAAGCAVIATTVGGIPEIVLDGETGMLVPPDDPGVTASALETLLTDHAFRAELSKHASAHAADFDWDGIAKSYAALYEQSTY